MGSHWLAPRVTGSRDRITGTPCPNVHAEPLPDALETHRPGAWAQKFPRLTCVQSHRFPSYLNEPEDSRMWTGRACLVWIQTLWFWVPSAALSAPPVTGNDLFQGKGLRGPATAPPGLPCRGAGTAYKTSTLCPPRGLMPTAPSPLASPTTPPRRPPAPPPADSWTNKPGVRGM